MRGITAEMDAIRTGFEDNTYGGEDQPSHSAQSERFRRSREPR